MWVFSPRPRNECVLGARGKAFPKSLVHERTDDETTLVITPTVVRIPREIVSQNSKSFFSFFFLMSINGGCSSSSRI